MIRKIIRIDENKCDGCGLCVSACHEGAIGLVDGKAKLLRDDYCDGLGNCLPVCPTGAITFEEREAADYDEAAVKASQEKSGPDTLACGCPSAHTRSLGDDSCGETEEDAEETCCAQVKTQLKQWPVQIELVPPNATYLRKANLLIAADCCAYAYGNFHAEMMKDRITLIGCPKLDDIDYAEKLTAILKVNDIQSVTVARMEVPCCGGLVHAVETALRNSGKRIPYQAVVFSVEGAILEG